MQGYKPLQRILIKLLKNLRTNKMYFPKLKVFTNSKIRVLIESRA